MNPSRNDPKSATERLWKRFHDAYWIEVRKQLPIPISSSHPVITEVPFPDMPKIIDSQSVETLLQAVSETVLSSASSTPPPMLASVEVLHYLEWYSLIMTREVPTYLSQAISRLEVLPDETSPPSCWHLRRKVLQELIEKWCQERSSNSLWDLIMPRVWDRLNDYSYSDLKFLEGKTWKQIGYESLFRIWNHESWYTFNPFARRCFLPGILVAALQYYDDASLHLPFTTVAWCEDYKEYSQAEKEIVYYVLVYLQLCPDPEDDMDNELIKDYRRATRAWESVVLELKQPMFIPLESQEL